MIFFSKSCQISMFSEKVRKVVKFPIGRKFASLTKSCEIPEKLRNSRNSRNCQKVQNSLKFWKKVVRNLPYQRLINSRNQKKVTFFHFWAQKPRYFPGKISRSALNLSLFFRCGNFFGPTFLKISQLFENFATFDKFWKSRNSQLFAKFLKFRNFCENHHRSEMSFFGVLWQKVRVWSKSCCFCGFFRSNAQHDDGNRTHHVQSYWEGPWLSGSFGSEGRPTWNGEGRNREPSSPPKGCR